jgi:hypothetical protein
VADPTPRKRVVRKPATRTTRAITAAVADAGELTGHDMQAQIESVRTGEVDSLVRTVTGEIVAETEAVEFFGAWYRIRTGKIGLMPLLKFAHSASKGADSGDLAGLAAMYAMIRGAIHRDDWEAFEYAAMDNDADDKDLFAVVQTVIERVSARPTAPPSDSSSGRPTTSPNLKDSPESGQRPASTRPQVDGLVSVSDLLR